MKNLSGRRHQFLDSLIIQKNPVQNIRPGTTNVKLEANSLKPMNRKEEIKEFNKLKKRCDGIRYLIEAKWIKDWLAGLNPGIVQTMNLIDAKGCLKPKLRLKKDYFAYNKKQWNFLEQRYGAEPLVMRSVEELGIKKKQKTQIELFKGLTFGGNISPKSSSPSKEKKTPPELPLIVGDIDSVTIDKDYSPTFGLANPGLMCYMNASFQMLLSLPVLCSKLLSIHSHENEIAKLFIDFLKEAYQKEETVLSPESLWRAVGNVFPTEKQHDLPEFVRFLVNSLSVSMFSGTFLSTVTCEKCSNESHTKEEFSDIQLGIHSSLVESLHSFTSEEKIEAVSPCEKCGTKEIIKKIEVLEGPECLFIQLKRFTGGKNTQKIDSHVEVSPEINISQKSYELVAIAVHNGNAESGHYFAYCYRNGLWYLFDDEKIQRVNFDEVLGQQAYLVLYKELNSESSN